MKILKSHLNPGSMLVNNKTNQDYGVMVEQVSPNKIVVFRLDKTHILFLVD